jgi:outer membrane protein TolC
MPQSSDVVGVSYGETSNSGFLGLLTDQIRLQNQRQNIVNIEGSLQQFEEFFLSDKFTDRTQVEQMRRQRLTSQSGLVRQKEAYHRNTETFLRSIGLPPDLKVKISDPIVESFELMSPSLLRLQEKVGDFLNEVRKEDDPLPEDLRERIGNLIQKGESELGKIVYDLEQLEKKTADRLAGFNVLKLWAEKEMKNGERIDPSIYDSAIYRNRIGELKQEEDSARIRAAITLLKLFVNNDEPALRTMFERRTFEADVLDALILLELTDLGGKSEELQINSQIDTTWSAVQAEENLLESREKLQLLQEQLKAEEAAATLTPKAPILEESDRLTRERLSQLIRKTDDYRTWLSRILNAYGNELMGLAILQTRIRIDCFTLTPTEISAEDAFNIASQCRLDWMNQRASLVDQWRQLEIAANNLRGDLKLTVNGEIGTIDKSGVRFDGDNGSIKMGLQWDSPMTRHNEMIAYRKSQIAYQRSRRNYYSYVDSVNAELRNLLRRIETNLIDFEIQRNTILATTLQVDLAQLKLIKPPGRNERFDPNLARDLTDSLQGLLESQNKFLEIWIENQTLRMQLDLLMGTMQLDRRGNWIDPGPISAERLGAPLRGDEPLPIPSIPKPTLRPKLAPEPPVAKAELEEMEDTVPVPLRFDGIATPLELRAIPSKKLTSKNAPLPPQTPE